MCRICIPIKVAILGGDPVVGHALEILLETAGCATRFFAESSVDTAGELLVNVHLVILAPRVSGRLRRDLTASMAAAPVTRRAAVLELVTTPEEARAGQGAALLWPCGLERLQKEIEQVVQGRGVTRTTHVI